MEPEVSNASFVLLLLLCRSAYACLAEYFSLLFNQLSVIMFLFIFAVIQCDDKAFSLKGISFSVSPGEVVAVIGPVGAGKVSA